jgi:DNA-binding NarL/FixJ family response regulator
VRVVILSPDSTVVQAMHAMEAGAMAFVSKTADPADLRTAIMAVDKGERWLAMDLVQQMALMRSRGTGRSSALSDREISVLRELVRGRSMAEIAGVLSVSYKTVTNDCAALRAKLNARTNPQLVRVALELKLT